MKKVWIIVAIFSLLVTLNAKEVVGKYVIYEPLEREVAITFQIDGKEMMFFAPDPYGEVEEILRKRQNEFVRIKYSKRTDNGAEILENVYFNDGVTLLKEKSIVNDTINYIDENEKACNNGDTRKCYELAQENAGFLEAPGYYNKACEGGHAKACYELASIYELGNRAVAKDVELSKKFYRMACKGGYSDACGVVKKLNKKFGGKRSSLYDVLNAAFPRIKGIKPIDSKSNVLVADNSAKCMLVGKISFNPLRIINVPILETISWGKAPLSGMTKSVIYLDNKSFFFKKAHYSNGVKYFDEYESIGKRYNYNLWRVSEGKRTFFIIPGEARKKFILECYYTR